MARYIDADLAPFYLNKEDCEMINRIPTADVQEVKHGSSTLFICSECSYTFEHEGYMRFFNYCPNCGLRVDGENKC